MTSNGPVLGASLGGLAKTSLREQALDQLRNAVTSGEIAPGTRLLETELSAALGISRGTLREALRQLQQEGLVEAGERGRLTVRTLSDQEILDMFAVRAALEGLAAFIVAGRADRAPLNHRAARHRIGQGSRRTPARPGNECRAPSLCRTPAGQLRPPFRASRRSIRASLDAVGKVRCRRPGRGRHRDLRRRARSDAALRCP